MGMFSLLYIQSCVQIYRKLHLQTMIQRRNIKTFHSRFIICHFDINTVIVKTCIDPVNLPASELHLVPAWKKVSFFYLLCQRPHRSSDKTFDPGDHIFISRRTEKNGIPIIYYAFFHTLIDHLITKSFRYFLPFHFLRICLFGKRLQRLVRDISEIKRLKPIFFPV